jgi:hypothetical protein
VEKRGQFVAAGRSAGNENRRWHGTRRECSLGDPGNTKFCASTTCSLCCIVRTSFDLSLFGKKTGWGRCVVFLFEALLSRFLKRVQVRKRHLYLVYVVKVRARLGSERICVNATTICVSQVQRLLA